MESIDKAAHFVNGWFRGGVIGNPDAVKALAAALESYAAEERERVLEIVDAVDGHIARTIAARIREAGDPKSRTVGDGLHRTRAITAQKQNLP